MNIKEKVTERFLTYVQISSETKNEKNFADFLLKELTQLGFQVEMDDAGASFGGNCGNIIAYMPGQADEMPIFLSGHMDTVSPGVDIIPEIRDGVVYSKGDTILGGDDKAGIASIITAIESLLSQGKKIGPLELLLTVAEEGGLRGSQYLDPSKLKSKQGFILDSSKHVGEIITKAPGQGHISAKIYGKAAHAGVCPENGISAVSIFTEAIQSMKLLRIDEETTANIGKVSGGTATNIVMPMMTVEAEARSLNLDKLQDQMNHMEACFLNAAKKLGGHVEIEQKILYPSLNVASDAFGVMLAKKAFRSIGIEAETTFTGGGSDANVLNGKGFEVINLGINEQKAHTLDECYAIDDLVTMTLFVESLINEKNNSKHHI